MRFRIYERLLLVVCVLIFPTYTSAVSPQFWTVGNYSDLSKGRLKNISLSRDGRLSLAPEFTPLLDLDQALVWAAFFDPKNHFLYVGTGHDGKVFKIDRKGESTLFFDAAELDVLALALDDHQELYAATSPDGKIYRVDRTGKASVFFDPDDKYVWDMVFDSKGTLFAATGSKGRLYKISREGKGEVFFESGQTNLMCLALDGNGQILAGSEPDGHLYRIAPDGKPFVLYDSSLREIHQIQTDPQGSIYFIAIGGPSTSPLLESPRPSVEPAVAQLTVQVGGGVERRQEEQSSQVRTTSPAPAFRQDQGNLKSSIGRVARENLVETLWTAENETAYSLLLQGEGKLLFSTGVKGRIFQLDGQKRPALLLETSEEQTTRLISAGAEVYACTSNLAKIFRMKSTVHEEGTYESEVKDTQSVSTWGSLQWQAETPPGTDLRLFTRSGNTQKPEKTWSDWSGPYHQAEGTSIQSPRARYIQFKADLKARDGKSPFLGQVVLPFLPQNFPPEVKSIQILPRGVALYSNNSLSSSRSRQSQADQGSAEASGAREVVSPSASVSIPPRKALEKGAQSFTWEAEDRNGDDLTFSIFIRGEKEQSWRLLAEKQEEKIFTLTSESLPDGRYYLRITASDSPDNPAGQALAGEQVSAAFELDNAPPRVELLSQEGAEGKASVRFKAQDALSPLRKAELSTDGNDWLPCYSADGIVDSRVEEFQFQEGSLEPGEHIFTLRIYDAAGNVGLGKAVVPVKRKP